MNAHSLVLAAVSPHLANLLSADAADQEGDCIVRSDVSDDDGDGNTVVSPYLANLLSADAADPEGDGNEMAMLMAMGTVMTTMAMLTAMANSMRIAIMIITAEATR